ncbi:MAG: metallophosphoesterase [Chloroflexi bacterium]|nr:metallophosphoesterase [Chloroflexota bacterium]
MKRIVFCLVGLTFLFTACAAPIPSRPSPTPILTTATAFPPSVPSLPTETLAPALTAEPLAVKFAVIGDYGMDNSAEADVAALIQGWHPDFVITTGDNNYPSGAADTIDANIGKYFHDFIFPYVGAYGPEADVNRFFPTLGNHDWYTSEAQPYLDYFSLPGNERYYDFVWGPVHFFAIDSDEHEPDGINAGSAQAAWLQQGLAGSTSTWNIVYMHYPPYSSGAHGSTDWMQWPFATWGADGLLAGHDHLYERLLVDGIPYFTNGAGGGGLYDFGDPLPESKFRYNANYGAMLVTASETEILFEFYNRAGDLIDSYRVTKP